MLEQINFNNAVYGGEFQHIIYIPKTCKFEVTSTANGTVTSITTATPHCLSTGDLVQLCLGHSEDCQILSPSQQFVATRVSDTVFTIPYNSQDCPRPMTGEGFEPLNLAGFVFSAEIISSTTEGPTIGGHGAAIEAGDRVVKISGNSSDLSRISEGGKITIEGAVVESLVLGVSSVNEPLCCNSRNPVEPFVFVTLESPAGASVLDAGWFVTCSRDGIGEKIIDAGVSKRDAFGELTFTFDTTALDSENRYYYRIYEAVGAGNTPRFYGEIAWGESTGISKSISTCVALFPVVVANPEAINNVSIYVPNIAALTALTGLTDGTIRHPAGYFTAGDVGLEPYRLEPSAGRTPNGGAWVASVIPGKVWVCQYAGPITTASFGAIPNGVTDAIGALDRAWTFFRGQKKMTLFIAPGNYNLSRYWMIGYLDNTADFLPRLISGWGAVFNRPIMWGELALSIEGLAVDGSPSYGFVPLRGQGATFTGLVARNCASHGFFFDGDTTDPNLGGLNVNYQVTRATFNQCVSFNNGGDGWHFTGVGDINRSWCNATQFSSCSAVNNDGQGFFVTESAASGNLSRFSYCTFTNLNIEGNNVVGTATPSLTIIGGSSCTFLGGHFVNVDASGISTRITGGNNYFLGGRHIGLIDIGGSGTGAEIVNSPASGESGSIVNIRGADFISANKIETNFFENILALSQVPQSMLTFSQNGTTGPHTIDVELTTIPLSKHFVFVIYAFGRRGSTPTTAPHRAFLKATIYGAKDSSGAVTLDFAEDASNGLTPASLSVSYSGTKARVTFSTSDIIPSLSGFAECHLFGDKLIAA